MLSSRIAATAVVVASIVTFRVDALAQGPETRPLILFVHGRAQQHRLADQLLRDFRDALRDGLRRIGDGSLALELRDEDVRIVRYYDLSMPTDPPVDRTAVLCEGSPQQMTNSGKVPSAFAFAAIDGPQRKSLLNLVERAPFVPATSTLFLEDTRSYLKHLPTRCATNLRLTDELIQAREQRRKVIIVAHSMGSLVTFDALAFPRPISAAALVRSDGIDSGTVRRVIVIGTQLPAKELRGMLDSNGESRRLRAADVTSVVLAKGRFDWVGMRAHDGGPFVTDDTPFADLEIDTDPEDPHSVRSYLQHPLVALAIAKPYCDALGKGCEPKQLQLSLCDYDSLARSAIADMYASADARARAYSRWLADGRKESSGLLLANMSRSTQLAPFSGREEHLDAPTRVGCSSMRSDVSTANTRNPTDSVRLFGINVGTVIEHDGVRARNAATLEFSLPSILELLPLKRWNLGLLSERDLRVGYEFDDARGEIYVRAHTGFGSYVRVVPRRGIADLQGQAFGMSFGHLLSLVPSLRGVFSHQLNRPGNDLFVEYRSGGQARATKRGAVGGRWVFF